MTEAQPKLPTARPSHRSFETEFTVSGIALACHGFVQHHADMCMASVVVKNDTTRPRNRKMFQRQILAVRLVQTKVGLPVNVSARVLALERSIPMQFVAAFLATGMMLQNELDCAAAPLISPVCRGAVSPLNSVETLEAVAMKRGTRE